MQPRQLGVLTALFDDIKARVDDDTLEFGFVKHSLDTILLGPQLPQTNSKGKLRLGGSFSVDGSPDIKELEIVQTKFRVWAFEGYEEIGIRLGPFFTDFGSPETCGGEAAILTSINRLSIPEFLQELVHGKVRKLSEVATELIKSELSFSIKQVMDAIQNNAVEKTVGKTKKSSLFLVHNRHMTDLGVIAVSCAKHELFGKDLESIYPYAAGTMLVCRNIPEQFKSK